MRIARLPVCRTTWRCQASSAKVTIIAKVETAMPSPAALVSTVPVSCEIARMAIAVADTAISIT